MRKRALALWPKFIEEEEAVPIRPVAPEAWVQEEEVLRLQLEMQKAMNEPHIEKVREVLAAIDVRKLVL